MDFRERNQTNIGAKLEALSIVNYFSTLIVAILLPIGIGIISYFLLHLKLGQTHGVSYIISVFPTLGAYFFISRLLVNHKSQTKRGQHKGTHAEAKKRIDSRRANNDQGLSFGGLFLPSEAATGHFLTVGTTGSGKTVTIKLLMNDALKPIKNKSNNKAILFDAKRELYAYLLKIDFESYNPQTKKGQIYPNLKRLPHFTNTRLIKSACAIGLSKCLL
jgi:hypothetical protein